MLRIVKITMFVCLITPLALAGAALAQGTAHQSFVVMAGGGSIAQVDVMDFAPHTLKIHRGDSVTWLTAGFHDVDFNTQAQPFVIAPMVNGKPSPQLNPAVVYPNIPANHVYKGGVASSGFPVIPNASPTFTLTFDVAPGTYTYYCDMHPDMTGQIVVVPVLGRFGRRVPLDRNPRSGQIAELRRRHHRHAHCAVRRHFQRPVGNQPRHRFAHRHDGDTKDVGRRPQRQLFARSEPAGNQ